MKTRFVSAMLLLLMMCVLGAASVSLAGSMPPGFDDPANNPTKQKWTPKPFGPPPEPNQPWPESEPLPPGPIPPDGGDNPFGEPSVEIGDGWESEWMNPPGTDPNDPHVPPIPTWHYNGQHAGGGNGTLKIHIPNSPDPNPLKHVWFAITADKSVSDAARPITVTRGYDGGEPSGASVKWDPAAWKSIQLGPPAGSADGGVWYRYEGMVTIKPNPQWETLEFDILDCTNIAEIEVRSVCIPVPEPTSMSLLLVGLGGLLVFARRRK